MVVTHNLDEAPRLADRITIMKDRFPNPNSSPSIKTAKDEMFNSLDPAMVLKKLFGSSRNK
jgi:ABC-type nitrate/sulfonate/bicarbonate transport system ATPase subunit